MDWIQTLFTICRARLCCPSDAADHAIRSALSLFLILILTGSHGGGESGNEEERILKWVNMHNYAVKAAIGNISVALVTDTIHPEARGTVDVDFPFPVLVEESRIND